MRLLRCPRNFGSEGFMVELFMASFLVTLKSKLYKSNLVSRGALPGFVLLINPHDE